MSKFTLAFFLALGIAIAPPASAQVIQASVGITPTCPYGLSACWAGAYEGLTKMGGVGTVSQTPDAYNCIASVSVIGNKLPDVAKWKQQFKSDVHDSYVFRGVELTVEGSIQDVNGVLKLKIPKVDTLVALGPLQHKLEWNFEKQKSREPEEDEKNAYAELKSVASTAKGSRLRIKGPFQSSQTLPKMEVREFLVLSHGD